MGTRCWSMAITLVVAWAISACDDADAREAAARADELERRVAELTEQIEALETERERDAGSVEAEGETADAPEERCRDLAARLAACRERLERCEQDPFKGGKYFTAEGGAPAPSKKDGVLDPFAGERPRPAADPAPVEDPFEDR